MPVIRADALIARKAARLLLPNVVIAGAPKCGTTSVFAWLADHPDVCASSVKETYFFMDREWPTFNARSNYADHGLGAYASYFEHCDVSSSRVILEGTPGYIYQETAREMLAQLESKPRVIFLLRKPSERVYSFYEYARNNLATLDRSITFAQFVELAAREDQGRLTDLTRWAITQSRYVDYLERWLEHFPPGRIQLLLFEHMIRDERRFMRDLATHLGLEPSYYDSYPFLRKKPTVRTRSSRLHRLRLSLGRMIPAGRFKKRAHRALKAPYAALNFRVGSGDRSDEERAVLARLDSEFAPDNRRLAQLTGLDLSIWGEATR
ncbi:MAG: sulfotransferase domain-containing protein [Candidatus Limnocylindria bacterium]